MEKLTKFERVLYYPVALTLTFFTAGLWSGATIDYASLLTWATPVLAVATWMLPFSGKYFAVARVISLAGFALVGFALVLYSPWIVGLISTI